MFNLPQDFFSSFIKSQYTTLPYPQANLDGQTVIVTGANVGLGLEAARHFVRLNAGKVILGCRDLEKGEAAKTKIEQTTNRKGVVEVWQVDLSTYESVKKFCTRAQTLTRLDIVVENAGIAVPYYQEFEGHESTITVNVISTFLMALLLLPTLRESAAKTKVTPHLTIVASDAHFVANFKERTSLAIFTALDNPVGKNQSEKYNISKLLEILTIRELAPKMTVSTESGRPAVILNTLTPGLCESQLMRHASFLLAIGAKIGKALLARNSEVGSRTLVSAALAGEDTHGEYMADCKIAQPSTFVRSNEGAQVQKRVYDELMAILEGIEPGITKNI